MTDPRPHKNAPHKIPAGGAPDREEGGPTTAAFTPSGPTAHAPSYLYAIFSYR